MDMNVLCLHPPLEENDQVSLILRDDLHHIILSFPKLYKDKFFCLFEEEKGYPVLGDLNLHPKSAPRLCLRQLLIK